LIVAVVIIVLFGSKKLPGAARSLGQSMRILKREVSDLHDEEPDAAPKDSAGPSTQFPQAQLAPAAAPPADQQGQIDALQQQIRDLQRSATMDTPASAGSTAEPQRTQQPS
jgi:sec-independent protein translocase protein TatA